MEELMKDEPEAKEEEGQTIGEKNFKIMKLRGRIRSRPVTADEDHIT